MKIVTFNLRNDWYGDGINSFIHRAGMVYEAISEEMPDVIGVQEGRTQNMGFLKKIFPEYTFIGHGRDADFGGEGVYTAVRNDTVEVLDSETLWISPTPYTPGSRYENQSECPRTCNIMQIRFRETGERMWVYNIHLDHISEAARVEGMQCVLQLVAERQAKAELPVVILGDFNAEPEAEAIKTCDACSWMRDVTKDIPVSFHDFGKKGIKIDYIYMSNALADRVQKVTVWDKEESGIYLSDHYPICAELL